MSTIDDLRGTLDRHAAGLDDHAVHARPMAVRERIRVVRRRRRGAAAAALTAVLVAGGAGLVPLLHGTTPSPAHAPKRLAGQVVPDRTTYAGFEFSYDGAAASRPGARTLTMQLPATHVRRVVSLAADRLGGGTATLVLGGRPLARATADGLVPAVAVPADRTDLRVRLSGASADAVVGLAVFDRTARMPAGIGNDDAVFRSTIGDRTLVGGAMSEPGQASLSVELPASARLDFSDYCHSPEPGYKVNVSVGGHSLLGGACNEDSGEDPGTSYVTPGGPHGDRVRVWLSRTLGGEPVAVPGAVIGVGAYREEGRTVVAGVGRVPAVVEQDGRTWVLDHVVGPGVDGGVRTTIDTSGGPLLAGFVTAGRQGFAFRIAGREPGAGDVQRFAPGIGARGDGTLLLPGDRYSVRLVPAGGSGGFRGAVTVYVPAG